jgi:GNAT superfamily N-acetyltransferase
MQRAAYRIKRADGTDPEIARIICDMHTEIFADTAPQVVPKEGWWWLVWKGVEPVAFAGLRLAASTPSTGYLHRSGVLPKHRGHRLQVRLIRIREAMARSLGLKRMVSDTTGNIASSNSLIRAGYRLFEPVGKWAFGDDSLYWEKAL